ncbi:helix-turn-helix domain-containing protein [Staphylococcus gallinarum]|uniref:helix-turn-helix domain-containing protein n=1 Tax=Staphylococcus gallinarum TaxID=1293 RepID=UPI001C1F6B5D|nr:helix-turn-helix domain-containing protein [Staphylococcus gallinarum]MBU7218390.1 helix-turn-helix domain-containing protein [Staphylococcus gallinarum]
MNSNFSNRLKEAMITSNLKQVDIVEKSKKYFEDTGVKISKTDLSQYVNGKVKPGQNKLYVLAKVLDVSEAWLLGFDVPKNRISDEKRNEVNNQSLNVAAHIDGDFTEEEVQKIIEYAEEVRRKRLEQQNSDKGE